MNASSRFGSMGMIGADSLSGAVSDTGSESEAVWRKTRRFGFGVAAGVAVVVGACGGSTGGGNPSPSPTPIPGGGTTTPTITIANNAVSPKSITVTRGSQVTFMNNDNQAHDMESDPHPVHTDCPEINQVGFLNPGQSRRTGALNIARTCGYHDHNRDILESLQGTIVIQ